MQQLPETEHSPSLLQKQNDKVLFGKYYIQSHIKGKVVAVQGKSLHGPGGGGGCAGVSAGSFFTLALETSQWSKLYRKEKHLPYAEHTKTLYGKGVEIVTLKGLTC
jgi:hypothetical protein